MNSLERHPECDPTTPPCCSFRAVRYFVVLLAAAWLIGGTFLPAATTYRWQLDSTLDPVVVFVDPGLDAVVRRALNNLAGDIHQSDVEKITYLNSEGAPISSLEGIQALHNLTALQLHGGNITDLTPLRNLTNLTGLSVSVNKVTDLAPLAGLKNLVGLDIEHNGITSIGALGGLTNLVKVGISANPIADLSPLAGLINLRDLQMYGLPATDLAPLRNLVHLSTAIIGNYDSFVDLSPLSGCVALQYLSIEYTRINSLSPLYNLAALKCVAMGHHQTWGSGGNRINWDMDPLASKLVFWDDGVMWLSFPKVSTPGIPNIALEDGHDHLNADSTDISNDVSVLRRGGSAMRGTVADGVSKLVLKVTCDVPSQMRFSLANSGTDDGALTQLTSAGNPLDCALAAYQPPATFVASGDDTIRAIRFADVAIEVKLPYDGSILTLNFNRKIALVRCPVVLVHGLFSNGIDAWDKSGFALALARSLPGLPLYVADYASSNDREFAANQSVVPDAITFAGGSLNNSGIAMSKADVIGHSMGGILARIHAGTGDGASSSFFRNPANYRTGAINKLITIDTPHYGAGMAELLTGSVDPQLASCTESIRRLLLLRGNNANNGATRDLACWSEAIARLNATQASVPSHAICGAYTGTLDDSAEGLEQLLLEAVHSATVNTDLGWYYLSNRGRPTDIVVSLESQLGGLQPPKVSIYDHQHSGATRDVRVIQKVLELLDASTGDSCFAAEFPVNQEPVYSIGTTARPSAGGYTFGFGRRLADSSAAVHAAAIWGYSFRNWTEDGVTVSATPGYTFTCSGNRTLVANFDSTVSSRIHALAPTLASAKFAVTWSGTSTGSDRITSYDIYVRTDADTWKPWLHNTPETSSTWLGDYGHKYQFYVVPRDGDNVGAPPDDASLPQAETTVLARPPIITSAASTTFTVGRPGSFTVAASGAPKPALAVIGLLPGWATFDASTGLLAGTPNTINGTPFIFTVAADNGFGTQAIQAFTLNVQVSTGAPRITATPASRTVILGHQTLFAVDATGAGEGTYQWYKDGTVLPGATSANLLLGSVQPADAGAYVVVVTNASGSTSSEPAVLGVVAAGTSASHGLSPCSYTAGGQLTVTSTLTYSAPVTALGWRVLLPGPGWNLMTSTGPVASTSPAVGTSDLLEWEWTTIPPSPLTFTYTIAVPLDSKGTKRIAAVAILHQGGGAAQVLSHPDPLFVLREAERHLADSSADGRIELSELLRVIELYNARNGTIRTGAYAVQPETEDGFAPDAHRTPSEVVTLRCYHSSDVNRDGKIGLLELLRVIELYNCRSGTVRTGEYHAERDTEDGFAPGPDPTSPEP